MTAKLPAAITLGTSEMASAAAVITVRLLDQGVFGKGLTASERLTNRVNSYA